MEKVFYWIKLRIDFFNSPEMKLISSLENGADYIIFWIKLLLIAVKEAEPGILRYNENLPYTPEMLAAVMDTNIDIVRAALTYFQKFGMIEMQDNGDILIPSVPGLVGSETTAAIRQCRHREKKKLEEQGTPLIKDMRDNVTSMSQNGHTELELEKEKEVTINPSFSPTINHTILKTIKSNGELETLMKGCGMGKEFNALIKRGRQYLGITDPRPCEYFVKIGEKKLERGTDDIHKIWEGTMRAIKDDEDIGLRPGPG